MNGQVATGFDRLAPVYKLLSRIVFGKKLEQAQLHFLHCIKPDDRVLILGGGTGDLLNNLLQNHPTLAVDYVDISERMILLARKKTQNASTVNFITGTEQHIPDRTYTVVITNFYLDLFSDHTLHGIVQKIKTHLSADAQWLATDFVNEKDWHKVMLGCMYAFFRMITHIEASRLPDWQSSLKKAGMYEVNSKKFYHGFIKSSVYGFVT